MISDHYRKILEQVHTTAGPWGTAARYHFDTIKRFVQETGSRQLLDYGAGSSGFLARELPKHVTGIEIHSYDPGIPEISARPDPADIVLCIDVLEHVEPENIDAVLDDLKRVTIRHGLFNIATRPAERILPDGRNAHLIVESESWWEQKIQARWNNITRYDNLFRITV